MRTQLLCSSQIFQYFSTEMQSDGVDPRVSGKPQKSQLGYLGSRLRIKPGAFRMCEPSTRMLDAFQRVHCNGSNDQVSVLVTLA
jgi:hypothetical protein